MKKYKISFAFNHKFIFFYSLFTFFLVLLTRHLQSKCWCHLQKDRSLRFWKYYVNRLYHHHSFNVSVPLKVGRKAPMFVPSFFLHSILFAGSALDSFQCLRSLLIIYFHVFLCLPCPRCPTTSNSVMLLIQPSFLTTCPNQRSRLYRNKVCMLLIPSFLRRV